jgi:hypothetical protein
VFCLGQAGGFLRVAQPKAGRKPKATRR